MRIIFNDEYETSLTSFKDITQTDQRVNNIYREINLELDYDEQDGAVYRFLLNNNILITKISVIDNNGIQYSLPLDNTYKVERLNHNINTTKNFFNIVLKIATTENNSDSQDRIER